jgi:hypothetical protein
MINILKILIILGILVQTASPQSNTGVLAIDTLPRFDWDIKTNRNSLAATLGFSLVFPGGGQFYAEHYTRGGFLFAFEAALIYETFYNKVRQRQVSDEKIGEYRDSVFSYQDLILFGNPDSADIWQAQRKKFDRLLSKEQAKKWKDNDLWNSELAWLAGLHIYGMFDAYGIWKNNNARNTETHSVFSAVWRGALIPGWGQIYNHEYGKAGMLYMGLLGSAVSLYSRQQMVEYHLGKLRIARKEEDATDMSQANEEILFFRKKRNQYVWAIALFYIYSLGDAGVDAMLHNFDNPMFFVMQPTLNKGFSAEAGFRF